ncbi:MAG: glycosyltransferase family 9 protein, partial [Bacteroidales bacterium]|nr:glycosyltransferase family 9 protein [Bacteroidales bacterium]
MEAALPKLRFPKGNLIISRTDAIGDVILTLPLASYLKSLEPGRKIIFLGRNYTKAIIEA